MQTGKLGLLFFLITHLSLLAIAQDAPKAPAAPWTARENRLIDTPDEIVAVLENGMVAIIKKYPLAPVAAVRLYVRTGSIYEQDHLGSGISHLFEHLLAGGATKNRTEKQSRETIQQIGARYNAFTSKAMTCYYLTVPAQHVGTALNLIADWVTRPIFPQEDFEREWGVVQRELEMGASDPDRQLHQIFDELRYKIHPARFPIIGHQSVLQQLTRQQILDYYHQKYVPDNSVLVIAGDINTEQMLQAVKKEFADFKRKSPPQSPLPAEPDLTAPRQIVRLFPAMQGPAKMILAFPSFHLQHPDLYALDTLASILGQGKSSRLYQSLREDKQLVLSINAMNSTPNWADGSFYIMSQLDPENVPAVKRALWQEIENIKYEPVQPDELARAKRQLQVGHIRSHQTAEQVAASMAEDYLATGDPHFSDHYVENMQAVTVEMVQKAAQKYLLPQKQLTAVITPKPLPPDQSQTLKTAAASKIKKITLENGLTVLLKRDSSVPLVNMRLYVLGGLLDETDENNGLTNLMVKLSLKATQNYSTTDIVDYFDSVGGLIVTGAGNNTYYYVAEVMPQDLQKAMEIYREVILKPTFPTDQLEKVKTLNLAAIQQLNNSWRGQARRFFREKFFINSPYRRTWLGKTDTVSAITPDQLRQFHNTSTVATRAVLAVFGDINLNDAETLIRRHFSDMPKGAAFNYDRFKPEPPLKEARRFIQKTQKPGAIVYLGFPGFKFTHIQDRYPMEVLMEIVGSTNGWLFEKLRGMQLVYYAWAYSFPGLTHSYIAATAQCEADKVPQVVQVAQEILQQAKTGQITSEQLDLAKNNRLNAKIMDKLTIADAAETAALDELYGFGYDWSAGYADRIMAVTLDDVKKVAQKYLSAPSTLTVITSEPQKLEENNPNSTTQTP